MTDIQGFLASIRRPRLLIRAARFGALEYRRERDLRRVLGLSRLPAPAQALEALAEAEEQAETTRRIGGGAYSVTRHVELLIALMGEARCLRHLG